MDISAIRRFDWRIMVGVGLGLLLIAGLAWFLSGRGQPPKGPPVMIMSSIPLQWGEATVTEIAQGEAETPGLLDALGKSRKTVLIDDFQQMAEPGKGALLLIQPRALAPRELVQLDAWIRKGGATVIFADPALDWPSELPLGDMRRPLFTSMLTPLFRHWGLELALPVDEAAITDIEVGAYRLSMKSGGIWEAADTKRPSAACNIRNDERLAYCTVGKGQALLIADADMLHEAQWTGKLMGGGTIEWLDAVLAPMSTGKPLPGSLWEIQGK